MYARIYQIRPDGRVERWSYLVGTSCAIRQVIPRAQCAREMRYLRAIGYGCSRGDYRG